MLMIGLTELDLMVVDLTSTRVFSLMNISTCYMMIMIVMK